MDTTSDSSTRFDKLKGAENWHEWKIRMQMELIRKDLWDIVDGPAESVPLPPPSGGSTSGTGTRSTTAATDEATKTYNDWTKSNRKALAEIMLRVETDQMMHINREKGGREAWASLCETYQKKGLADKLFLKRQLLRHRMPEGATIREHIATIGRLADALAAIGSPVPDDELGFTYLIGLHDSYDPLIMSLEAREEKALTSTFIKNALIHEEARRKDREGDNDGIAMFTRGNPRSGKRWQRDRTKVICYNCGKSGHFKDECRSQPKKDEENRNTSYLANIKRDLDVGF